MTVFTDQLAARRERFNSAFAAARFARPRLDGPAFLAVLREIVAPAVEAAAAARPERAPVIVEALYDLALELFRQDLLGPRARSAAIPLTWTDLLPRLGPFVAIDPARTTSTLSNAAYNLEQTSGVGVAEWMARMLQVAACTPDGDLDALLRAGQAAAWRSGMAHYRTGALAICAELSEPLVRAALGVQAGSSVVEALAGLRANRWHAPGAARSTEPRWMGEVGGFRGLGGPFLTLPRLSVDDQGLVVTEGERVWRLSADAFGATLMPLRAAPTQTSAEPRSWSLKPDGTLQIARQRTHLPALAQPLSSARFEDTLAVVTARSYRIKLVAI